MLQEILGAHGFNTAAFIGGYPLTKGDLHRGFDTFSHAPIIHDAWEGRGPFVPANLLVLQTLDWLAQHEGQDNFVFLHFFDAHLTLRAEFLGRARPPKDENGVYQNIEAYIGRRGVRYQEELDFISAQLAVLQDAADWDLLVITGDHGEKLQGERNYPWVYNARGQRISSHFHETELYDTQVRVPLYFAGPDWPAQTVSTQVRTIDIVPTILGWLNLPADPAPDGIDLRTGQSPPTAYSETYFAQLADANLHASNMHSQYSWGWVGIDSLVSLRTNTHKLICLANGEIRPFALFDLMEDPAEQHNLLAQQPGRVQTMLAALMALLADDQQWRMAGAAVDETVAQRLRDLGYL